MAEAPIRNIRNNYNKFCKPEHHSKTESSLPTTSSPKWKRSIPSEKTLRDGFNDVYKVLRPLAHMAWKSALFEWYVTDYLGHSIQAAISAESIDSGDEDRCNSGDVPHVLEGGAGWDIDEQDDDDEDEEQGGLDPSDYIEAHQYIDSRKPGRLVIAKEWVYWLRLVAAPAHYPFIFRADPLSGRTPNLSFRVLSYPPPATDMMPWKEVLRVLYPNPAEHAILVKELNKAYGRPKGSANMISDPDFSFKGVSHCEAVLACLHHPASSGEPADPGYRPLSPFAQLYIDSLTVDGSARRAGPAENRCPTHRAL